MYVRRSIAIPLCFLELYAQKANLPNACPLAAGAGLVPTGAGVVMMIVPCAHRPRVLAAVAPERINKRTRDPGWFITNRMPIREPLSHLG